MPPATPFCPRSFRLGNILTLAAVGVFTLLWWAWDNLLWWLLAE